MHVKRNTIVVISTHFLVIGHRISKQLTRQLMQQLSSESSLMYSSSTFSKQKHILIHKKQDTIQKKYLNVKGVKICTKSIYAAENDRNKSNV